MGTRSTYRTVLTTPGAIGFVLPGFVGRMSISMFGIGLVLLVSAVTGSYGLAGAVAATFAVSESVVSPLIGRWVDRYGQSRVLVPAVAVHALAMLVLLVAAEADAPAWAYLVCAAVSGAALPSVGSLVRARWSHLLAGSESRADALHTAYALESIADEVIFILGPVLVTFLATGVSRSAGLLAALALTVAGTLTLAAHRRTEPPASLEPAQGGTPVLRVPSLWRVALVFTAAGVVFGGMEVAVVGFADEFATRSDAGWVLALVAAGSFAAGLAYGARRWRAPLQHRVLRGAALFAVGTLAMAAAPSLPWLALAGFLTGTGISPMLIPAFGVVERDAPTGRLTEAMSWSNTSLALGLAVGSAVTGQAVDVAGSRGGLVVVAAAGLLTAVTALLGARQAGPAKARSS